MTASTAPGRMEVVPRTRHAASPEVRTRKVFTAGVDAGMFSVTASNGRQLSHPTAVSRSLTASGKVHVGALNPSSGPGHPKTKAVTVLMPGSFHSLIRNSHLKGNN